MCIMRVLEVFNRKPVTLVLYVLAVILVVYGSYIASPLYQISASTGLGLLFDQWYLRYFTVVLYIVPGLMTLFGLIARNKTFGQIGSFTMFLAFLFSTILRLITIGFTPAIWLFSLALALIAGICYLSDRVPDGP